MPHLQDRGIAYGALAPGRSGSDIALACCLAEVYQKNREIDRIEHDPWWVVFHLSADLVLLDLLGAWPTRAGASQLLNAGDKSSARAWAQAVYDIYPEIHGVIYPSSMHGGVSAIALNERPWAFNAVPKHPHVNIALGDPKVSRVVRKAAREIGYALVE